MADIKLEDILPGLKEHGVNTDENVDIDGNLNVAGTVTLTGEITAPGGVTTTDNVSVVTGGAATSGGNTTAALVMGSDGLGIYFGSGAPTISATKGSLYLNFTGSSTSTRLYVNNGTTNWVAVTTAS